MPRTIFKTDEPVVLEGYQAVLKPSKYGYSLATTIDICRAPAGALQISQT